MEIRCVGVMSPGDMGQAVAAQIKSKGLRVVAELDGRSERSRALRAGPAFPRYVAPPGLGPAGVRFIDRMRYDTKCLTAGLVGLGARGFLKIRQAGDAYLIERTGQEPASGSRASARSPRCCPASPARRWRSPRRTTRRCRPSPAWSSAKLAVLYEEKLFSRNRGSHVAGIGIAVAGVAAMVITDTPASLMIPVIVVMMVVLAVFARLLPAYSVEGRKLQDAIVGLRQYLSIAEKEDLARLKAPPQTAEEFTRFLPYAVALDVEEAWTRRFTQVLGAAAVAAAAGAFYSAGNGSGFSGSGLSNSIGGLSDTVSSASTPPGSSSGGSGGGGGGALRLRTELGSNPQTS